MTGDRIYSKPTVDGMDAGIEPTGTYLRRVGVGKCYPAVRNRQIMPVFSVTNEPLAAFV